MCSAPFAPNLLLLNSKRTGSYTLNQPYILASAYI